MLKEFTPMWDGSLGTIGVTEHRIDLLPGTRPISQHPYRAGPKAREEEKSQVEKMLRAGVIEPAQSSWASPVVLVPKSDGSWRLCIDYRRLNAVTVKDVYPIPRMDEYIDSLGSASVFTALDANWGYWQVPIRKGDRDKTAFVCHQGLYRFNRMPFGLTNAPATFQRAVDILLARFKWRTCLVYLDDIIVFSNNLDDHLSHVREIMRVLQDAGITLKLKKCEFFTDSVKYLGHVIRPGQLSVDEVRVKSLKEAKHPTTQTELPSFLGLCNVYRRFVPKFADVAAPLNHLLRKGQPVKLEPLADVEASAFSSLVDAVTSPPVLALPRLGLPFEVDTDASNNQVGCALFQISEDGERHPVGYWSRSLNVHERNFSVSEKECLAVVWALSTLRPYLMGTHFVVHTDHSALRWLMEISEPSGRLMRWRLRLSEFDFDVRYKKGTLNTQADALSRLGTSGEAEPADTLDIPCFLVEDLPDAAKVISDDVCDDILAAETAEPPDGSFIPITPE